MKIIDTGVLENSFMDFSLPSDFAKRALYYSPQFGHFYCNEAYQIARETLDLFLLVYVCRGTFSVDTRERHAEATDGQIVLLDCRHAHTYRCTEPSEFLWFHFTGNSSLHYAELLWEHFGLVFSGTHILPLRRDFDAILSIGQFVPMNEHLLSLHVQKILGTLAVPEQRTLVLNDLLSPAIAEMQQHYDQEIEVQQLAVLCNMSLSHFIRSFKKYISCTPHEYLLSYRLRQAKQLLLTTSLSIEQIAEQCGFGSASHFARAFRQRNEMTPSEFRMMQF